MNKRSLALLVLIIGSIAHLTAQNHAGWWNAEAGIVGGTSPTVAGLRGQATYAWSLYPDREGILWESARIEVGVESLANPSFTQVAGRLMMEPIAVFDIVVSAGLRAHYDAFGFGLAELGSFDQTLPSVRGDTGDTNEPSGQNALGTYVAFAPTLKAAVGPVLVANTLTMTRYAYGESAPSILEEPLSLRPVARDGWTATNNALALVSLDTRRLDFLSFGVEWNMAWSPFVAAPPANQRISAAGIAVAPLSDDLSLQIAAFAGSYLPGKPYEETPIYSLVAATIRWTSRE